MKTDRFPPLLRRPPFLLLCFLTTLLATAPDAQGAPFTFGNTGSFATARHAHTATVLPSGLVLIAGGRTNSATLASAELYNPASGTWATTGSLGTPRYGHTATLLPNGKVLVAGGYSGSSYLTSAELYDPASGTWGATGGFTTARSGHSATLLRDGKVLLAGGYGAGGVLASAELYDPGSGTWTVTGPLGGARGLHTATLLPDGKVLVAAGYGVSGVLTSAELFNPASGSWTPTGSLGAGRGAHTAMLLATGKVLVVGGSINSTFLLASLTSAELYDPANGTWAATGGLAAARDSHTATLLPNGRVLVSGGRNSGTFTSLASAELYNPQNGSWAATGSLAAARAEPTATLLPSGQVLVAGGGASSGNSLASAELFDPASGGWGPTGSLTRERSQHKATLLPNGKVLVTGAPGSSASPGTGEVYDPATGTWTATVRHAADQRARHTATLLSSGKVLVAGGAATSPLTSAELYDPASGSWAFTGGLATTRDSHTATLLTNGKVLVAGGKNSNNFLSSAEVYDPASGSWTSTGSLAVARQNHTATLLPNGKVLVAGGENSGGNPVAGTELYDPASGQWNPTLGNLGTGRLDHTATLLPNGKVLVAGGRGNGGFLASAELYDPASATWSPSAGLSVVRRFHTATLLPNGKVLVAGGQTTQTSSGHPDTEELYDPASAAWSHTPRLGSTRAVHTATLLLNGKVLVAGGTVLTSLASAELYETGLGFLLPDWVPQIASAPTTLASGSSLTLTGSRFQGISQASGGSYQDSSSNYPIVQLRALDSGQTAFLPVEPSAGWSDATFTSMPVNGFPLGPALVTVFTNGIPSDARYLVVTPPGLVANVSTRLPVGTDDNVLIEGFIVLGPNGSTKKILVRALGPFLTQFGITDALANPTLEIRDGTNTVIATNDDWRNTQAGGIITGDQSHAIHASGLAPAEDLESAIIAELAPGNFTAVVRGVNNTVGTGIVDAYDMSPASPARLANVATRGLIQPGDRLMIAGFITQQGEVRAVIRAIGPSLAAFGINNALPDTTLQLRDVNGTIVRENDDWQSHQKQELENTGLQPGDFREAAMVVTLPPGQYTAQVRGKPETTGIGVVEVYFLQ
jgi:N-acetylneuraminic acid mutarotase